MRKFVSGVWRLRVYSQGGFDFDRLVVGIGWVVADDVPLQISRRLLRKVGQS